GLLGRNFFFQAEDGIRDFHVTGVQTCALPISLVGNRPLPLYEAQELTSDEWALRFLGPAGITGLWQVTKRGRSEMSDEERRRLDNDYATDFSFWMDLRILMKTVPALFQKEAV